MAKCWALGPQPLASARDCGRPGKQKFETTGVRQIVPASKEPMRCTPEGGSRLAVILDPQLRLARDQPLVRPALRISLQLVSSRPRGSVQRCNPGVCWLNLPIAVPLTPRPDFAQRVYKKKSIIPLNINAES